MITIALLIISGIANAFMDRTADADNFAGSGLSSFRTDWFDHRLATDHRKWKDGDRAKGERFLGSSTIFVFVTDFWHFAKEVQLTCIQLAIALNFSPLLLQFPDLAIHPIACFIIDVLLFKTSIGVPFTIIHDKILSKMENKKTFWTWLRSFLYEMNWLKAIIVMLPLLLLWLGLAEWLNTFDPRFDPADDQTTFLGDIILVATFFITLLALAWRSYRIDRRKGGADHG